MKVLQICSSDSKPVFVNRDCICCVWIQEREMDVNMYDVYINTSGNEEFVICSLESKDVGTVYLKLVSAIFGDDAVVRVYNGTYNSNNLVDVVFEKGTGLTL